MAEFLSPLELEYVDGHNWKVTAPFEYHLGAPDGKERVVIPVGFVTDFASIPRIFWNILPPTGRYGKAAVIHDFLYQMRVIEVGDTGYRLAERIDADNALEEGMEVLGCGRLTRFIIYRGVRLGGGVIWKHYREAEHVDFLGR